MVGQTYYANMLVTRPATMLLRQIAHANMAGLLLHERTVAILDIDPVDPGGAGKAADNTDPNFHGPSQEVTPADGSRLSLRSGRDDGWKKALQDICGHMLRRTLIV